MIRQAGGNTFGVVTNQGTAPELRRRLKERFNEEVQTHYNFMDRQQDFIVAMNTEGKYEQAPLMTLAVGIVSPLAHRIEKYNSWQLSRLIR